MDVVDGLAGELAVILQDVVGGAVGCVLDCFGKFGERGATSGGCVFRELVECGCVMFWDDEDVAAGDGADVEECEGVLIFEDFVRGDLAGNDFAEDAVGVGVVLCGHGLLLVVGLLAMCVIVAKGCGLGE